MKTLRQKMLSPKEKALVDFIFHDAKIRPCHVFSWTREEDFPSYCGVSFNKDGDDFVCKYKDSPQCLVKFAEHQVDKLSLNNVIGVLPIFLFTFFIFLVLTAPDAFAATGQGGGLPYEAWLEKVRASITGPFAFTVGVIALIASGATLIFGGELNAFFKTLIFIVLIMALIVGAQNVMSMLFGASAVI